MPMSFGAGLEAHATHSKHTQKRTRMQARKPLAERMDVFERVVQLCTVRDRASQELRERLAKDGYKTDEIEGALNRALDCNLVDDERFAQAFIRGKVSAGKGARGIQEQLKKFGIDAEVIDGWPEAFDLAEESQIERAVALLQRRPPKAKDMWAAGYRKLISRGYSLPIAKKACQQWFNSLDSLSALEE